MEKPKPIHEIHYGTIKATVWKNKAEHGARQQITISRIYRKDGEWRSTDAIGRDDLLAVAKALNDAYGCICQHKEV